MIVHVRFSPEYPGIASTLTPIARNGSSIHAALEDPRDVTSLSARLADDGSASLNY
jgi:hypothetical protein